METKEGWSIDVSSSNYTHYYRDGISLCKRKIVKPFMDKFHNEKDYSQVLGYVCSLCEKKLKQDANK
jgi:hypothetical protein